MSVSCEQAIFNVVFLAQLLPYLTPISYLMLRRAHPCFVRGGSARYPSLGALCLRRFVENSRLAFVPEARNALLEHLCDGTIALTGDALLCLLQGDPMHPHVEQLEVICARERLANLLGPSALHTFPVFSMHPLFSVRLPPPSSFFVLAVPHVEGDNKRSLCIVHEASNVAALRSLRIADFGLSFYANTLRGSELIIRDPMAVLHRRAVFTWNSLLSRSEALYTKSGMHELVSAGLALITRLTTTLSYDIEVRYDWSVAAISARLRSLHPTPREAYDIMQRPIVKWEKEAYMIEAKRRWLPLEQERIAKMWHEVWENETQKGHP